MHGFARQTACAAEVFHEGLIGVRLGAAELVVHVGRNQAALARHSDRFQPAEQGHAIAPAGNRRQDRQVFPFLRRPRRRQAGFKWVEWHKYSVLSTQYPVPSSKY